MYVCVCVCHIHMSVCQHNNKSLAGVSSRTLLSHSLSDIEARVEGRRARQKNGGEGTRVRQRQMRL